MEVGNGWNAVMMLFVMHQPDQFKRPLQNISRESFDMFRKHVIPLLAVNTVTYTSNLSKPPIECTQIASKRLAGRVGAFI